MEFGFGESIPLACQDWANTKAAYRFFSNDRMSEEDILRGHFDASRRRFAASDGPILILHDTTEFGLSLHRDKTRHRGVWPVRGNEPLPARGGQAGDFRPR